MLPALGAYLVQVGDLTRTVYLASLPLVVATGLWLWTDELATRERDEAAGRDTMVGLFPLHFSGRWITLALAVAIYAALAGAVLARASLPPLALVALVSLWPVFLVVRIARTGYADAAEMQRARDHARVAYVVVSAILLLSCFQPR